MGNKKELLFSVTKDDLIRETFRCGGNGGQNVNKVETGVRFKHPPSGAVGESRTHRTQHQNEKEAFVRLCETTEFKNWHRLEVQRQIAIADGKQTIEQQVEEAMSQRNLKVEVKRDGKWVETESSENP